MTRMFSYALGALATFSVMLGSQALAGGSDFSFVPVTTRISMAIAAQNPIEIRCVDKTGKPVDGVTITRVRLDMAPDGMAQHTASARLIPADGPGLYRLDAQYTMTGRWQLSLAAKVDGEIETVTGKIVFDVAP